MDQSSFDEIMRIQRMMAQEVAHEQETDQKIEVMDVINDLVTGSKAIVQKEALLIETRMRGIPDSQVLRIIEYLKKDNFIIERDGYLKKI